METKQANDLGKLLKEAIDVFNIEISNVELPDNQKTPLLILRLVASERDRLKEELEKLEKENFELGREEEEWVKTLQEKQSLKEENERLKDELEAIRLVPSAYEGRVEAPELREICAKRFFNKSFEELTSDKDLIRLYQLIGATLDELRYAYAGENAMQSKEIDSLKQINSELVEALYEMFNILRSADTFINQILPTKDSYYKPDAWLKKAESLISKANQQK